MVDIECNVHCWGSNEHGECGIKVDKEKDGGWIDIPTRMKQFDDLIVDRVKCGDQHSYVHTECGMHILFGRNSSNVCIGEQAKSKPHCIDEIIYDKYKDVTQIVDVVLGRVNTIIICKVN